MQTYVFGVEGHSAVLEEEAGNACIAKATGVFKGWMVVAQLEKFLEQSHVCANVDALETRIARYLLVDADAVGAGGHAVNLNHRERKFSDCRPWKCPP